MCGILAAFGNNSEEFVRKNITKIVHRGPDYTNIYSTGSFSIGFTRLAINDQTDSGNQPIITENNITATNGEIYNFRELESKFNFSNPGKSDTHIIPFLFELLDYKILDELDGFYSSIIYNKNNGKLYTLRDYFGKKCLFLVKAKDLIIITSELKATPDIDEFLVIPKGFCEIDITNFKITKNISHTIKTYVEEYSLHQILVNAVKKRIPLENEKFGVFLSGGLDSSIITSIVNKLSDKAIYYILGKPNEVNDASYASKVLDFLNIENVKYIDLPTSDEIGKLINHVVYATESYNPSIISNGICSYLLAKEANKDNLKVILSGEGADELFYGYHYIDRNYAGWDRYRKNLINDLYLTELRRIDMACMANSIEARCPFLDTFVYRYSEQLEYNDFFHKKNDILYNKYILRETFKDKLPQEVVFRKKTSFDVGSGIRKIVVNYLRKNGRSEKDELYLIWKNMFSNVKDDTAIFFQSYPVFDAAIEKRGAVHK